MFNKIYRLPEVLDLTDLCRTSVYRALAAKDFPVPIMLGKRAVGWRESELMDWVQTRQQAQIYQIKTPTQRSGRGLVETLW